MSKRSWAGAAIVLLAMAAALSGCDSEQRPIETARHVDLERFMGTWYVIACIPTVIERDDFNATESYQRNPDGTIATTFAFNKGGPGGARKVYHPVGFVRDTASNALWGMRFVWPFKAEYRIVYLDEAYTETIIGRSARDYAWIMARTPSIPAADLAALRARLAADGYELSKLRLVPQDVVPAAAAGAR